jgi:hypothetical protein
MRKMPVLTMVCLVALGLVAVPSYSATVAANDTPDIVLQSGSVSFDLADFFSSAEGDLTYSADGAAISGSVVTVDGSSPVATFSAGGVSVESTVVVSDFVIGDGPAVDDNNRIVGVDGGNIFYNPLVPGGTINSKVNLSGLPAVGGQSTGTGQTGAAALVATVASVNMSVADTGLVQVSRQVADGSGLTPTLNADGSYSVAADASFGGTWVVTLGAVDGDSKDAVHLVAAEAVSVDLAGLTSLTGAGYANGTITGTEAGVLCYGAPIEVGQPGDVVTLTFDYTSSASAAIAGVLFDGALGSYLAHTNPSGSNIATGTAKSISMSMVTLTGTVIPAVQVAGAATVTLANMAVVNAGPVTDYALNPNATAYKSGLADLEGWGSDILGSGASAPTAAADNNFAGADGCMSLAGSGGIANAHVIVPLAAGTAVAECYAKKVSGEGTFALVLTDGAGMSSETFSALSDSWSKVIAVCTPSAPVAQGILVVQAAGFDVVVDDVCIRVVEDDDSFADLALLGM